MKSVAETWQLIDRIATALPAEKRTLDACLGRVLASPIHADADQPPFDRSAIDGFALAEGSSAGTYRIAGSIEPGAAAIPEIGNNEAYRIFTGAEVPSKAALVMVEDTEVQGESVQTKKPASTSLIRRRASSVRQGDCLLQAGTQIGPGEIAVLASVGALEVDVIPPPRLLHLTTGSEVVPPEQTPGRGQIRNTNGPLIQALAQQAGATIAAPSHVDEQRQSLVRAVETADPFDVLLVSGGSSVGNHDNTPAAFEALGFEILLHRVRVKPGKPLLIARRGQQLAFGIPGNPVSHFASWHAFIRRAIHHLAGLPPVALQTACLQSGAPLRSSDRETFWPAQLDIHEGILCAKPLSWLDSGAVSSLCGIQALLQIPAGDHRLTPGGSVVLLDCR